MRIHTCWLVKKKKKVTLNNNQGVGDLEKSKMLISVMVVKFKRSLAVACMVSLSTKIVT